MAQFETATGEKFVVNQVRPRVGGGVVVRDKSVDQLLQKVKEEERKAQELQQQYDALLANPPQAGTTFHGENVQISVAFFSDKEPLPAVFALLFLDPADLTYKLATHGKVGLKLFLNRKSQQLLKTALEHDYPSLFVEGGIIELNCSIRIIGYARSGRSAQAELVLE